MSRLQNPETGTVVDVQGELELLYRSRGWAEHNARPSKAVKVAPEKPSENDADTEDDKPVTRRNTRRK